jgi:hypothetical protein
LKEVKERIKIGNFRVLLDGQQRATSLYRAIKGVDDVWILFKSEEELGTEIKQKPINERSLEDVFLEVSGRQSRDYLSIRISDVYELFEVKVALDREKAAVLASSEYGKNLNVQDIENHTDFRRFLVYSKKLYDLFKSEKLLSYYMLDTDEEKFALFFERSNSKGIQLDFIDILAAKLYSGFNLREERAKFVEETRLKGERELQETLVRSIAYIVSDGREIERRYILTGLNASHFKRYWPDVVSLLVKVISYLADNHLLLSQEWFAYPNMLIPLIMFVKELRGQEFSQMSATQAANIKFWYWCSIFVQRYSTATNAVIIEDAAVLSKIARLDTGLDDSYRKRIRPAVESYEDLLAINKRQNAIYKGFLNFIGYSSDGLVDWRNGDRVSFNSDVDDHHIFPKKYLSTLKSEESEELPDSILNRALIPKLTNIRFSGQKPSVYLQQLEHRNHQLRQHLEKHMIPEGLVDGKYDENYPEFLRNRGDLFCKRLNKELSDLEAQSSGKPSGFGASANTPTTV